jgi:hypothetical protein
MPGEPDDESDASSCVINVPLLQSSETDDKIQRQKEADLLKWAAAELNKRHEKSFWSRVVFPLAMVVVTLAGLAACAVLCVPCLMGILAFSALTCPCVPVMNVPLWGAIFILIFQGWSLTNGHLSLIWS